MALCKWLENTQVSYVKTEEYVDQLFSFVRLTLCRRSTLQNLVKNETLPSVLKVKLYDQMCPQRDGHHAPKASNTTGSPNGQKQKHGKQQLEGDFQTPRTYTIQQEQGSEDEELQERVVIVGGKSTGDGQNAKIMYLDNEKRTINIASNSLCDTDAISVCATKDKIIFNGGYQSSSFLQNAKCLSKVYQFSAHTSKWSNLPDLLCPRRFHSSVCIHNKLYVIGGYCKDTHGKGPHSEVHVLDLNSRSWSKVKTMPVTNVIYIHSPGLGCCWY